MPSLPPVIAERLHNQHLARPPKQSAADIVARLGAVQSQDYPGARWGVAQRGRGLADAEVERAFDAGEIVRLHILRPTWHFVTPADLRWILSISAPRVHVANAFYARKLELDAKTLARGPGTRRHRRGGTAAGLPDDARRTRGARL